MDEVLTVHCKVCGATWELDYEPSACTCTDPDENDWELLSS